MKKTKPVKKVSLNKETLLSLQPENLERLRGGTWWDTGPSCTPYRYCTAAGWDC